MSASRAKNVVIVAVRRANFLVEVDLGIRSRARRKFRRRSAPHCASEALTPSDPFLYPY